MPDQPLRRPWRQRLRLSVRGSMILVLILGGWLSWIVNSARIQRDAVGAIRKAGGTIYYDKENSAERPGNRRLLAPEWRVNMIGIDYFDHVAAVDISGEGYDLAPVDGFMKRRVK